MINGQLILGILIPFLGTTLGAACVFFMKHEMKENLQKVLLGFAGGVMIAASVWSLLIPAIEQAVSTSKWQILILAAGVLSGMGFLLLMDVVIPHLHLNETKPEGTMGHTPKLSSNLMLCLAVTLHNIPEGMATGIVLAGALSGNGDITMASAMALSIGIAIQNFPEGAIISMPLAGNGNGKMKSFFMGTMSGIVEPIAAVITIWVSSTIQAALPFLLSFAAGAMLYVVVEELIPEAAKGEHSNIGPIGFILGFVLMMVLDVAFS